MAKTSTRTQKTEHTEAEVLIPPKLESVFDGPASYRCAYGGRGSGKTRTFAKMTAVWGYQHGMNGREGSILCAREFQNSLEDSSFSEVKAAIRSEPWLAAYYEIGETYIRSRDRRVNYSFAGLRRNLNSIKSKAQLLLVWVDEAEPVSETAWDILVPTVREEGAEIWVTWNPESEESATHKRFRRDPPEGAKVAEINWRDNPWFPKALNQKRLDDKAKRPKKYDHVWDGGFKVVVDDALFDPEWLGSYDAPPITLNRAIIRVDTATRDTKTADYTAAVCCGTDKADNAWLYGLDAIRGKWGFYEMCGKVGDFIERIARLKTQTFHLIRVDIEDANVGPALADFLRVDMKRRFRNTGLSVRINLAPRKDNKFIRAEKAVPYFEQGKFLLPSRPTRYGDGSWVPWFREEFASFSQADTHANDDALDGVIYRMLEEFGGDRLFSGVG